MFGSDEFLIYIPGNLLRQTNEIGNVKMKTNWKCRPKSSYETDKRLITVFKEGLKNKNIPQKEKEQECQQFVRDFNLHTELCQDDFEI